MARLIFLLFLLGSLATQAQDAVDEPINEQRTEFSGDEPPPPEFPYPGADLETDTDEETPVDEGIRASHQEPDDSDTPEGPPDVTDEHSLHAEVPLEPEAEPTPTYQPAPDKWGRKPRPRRYRITKDGATLYPRYVTPQKNSASLKIGAFGSPGIKNDETQLSFSDIYESSGLMILFDYEIQFTKSIGKLGLKLGTGLYQATGKGRFKSSGAEAKEVFTFYLVPNHVSLTYKFQYWERQILVPYVEGGIGYFGILENRDDGNRTRKGAAGVGVWAAGGAIQLDRVNSKTMAELDNDHGVNHIYVTAELRNFVGLRKDLDFSSSFVAGGFTFEF